MNCGARCWWLFSHSMVLLKLLYVYTRGVEFTLKLWNVFFQSMSLFQLCFYYPHCRSLSYKGLSMVRGIKIKIWIPLPFSHIYAVEELDRFLSLRCAETPVSFTWRASPTSPTGAPAWDFNLYWEVNLLPRPCF